MPNPRRRALRAFTLIELLVVISIIALLIGILLPALGRSRESALSVMCSTRLREMGTATHMYSDAHQGRIWPRDWARVRVNPLLFEPGPVFQFVDNVDEIMACPKNKRQGNGKDRSLLYDPKQLELDFDYTMIAGVQGARLDRDVPLYYADKRAANWPGTGTNSYYTEDQGDELLSRWPSMPIFVEESTFWYNAEVNDGWWGNLDQITQRHADKGHILFLNGTIQLVDYGADSAEHVQESWRDWVSNDVFVKMVGGGIARRFGYHRLFSQDNQKHGFIDAARE